MVNAVPLSKAYSVSNAKLIAAILAIQPAEIVESAQQPAPEDATSPEVVIEVETAVAVLEPGLDGTKGVYGPNDTIGGETNAVPFTAAVDDAEEDNPAKSQDLPGVIPAPIVSATSGMFKVSRKVFQRQLSVACRAIKTGASLPVLSCVLISFGKQRLRVESTNLDLSFATDTAAETEGTESIAINASVLSRFVAKCESEFLMAVVKDSQLFISDLTNKTNIMGIGAAEYPPMNRPNKAVEIMEISGKRLAQVITETQKCASTDETRYILNGLYFTLTKDAVVTTDGRRLCRVPLSADKVLADQANFILPSAPASAILHSVPLDAVAKVSLDDRRLFITSESGGFNYTAVSKIIDGTFPNYEQVIPKNSLHSFTLNRKNLSEALGRMFVLTTEKSQSVKFTFTTDSLLLNASSADVGSGKEEIKTKGTNSDKPVVVAFNPTYCIEILNSWSDEEVVLAVKDATSPVLLTAGAKLAVIMPVRLS
jgi:DNA polymerase-3 subunit beta